MNIKYCHRYYFVSGWIPVNLLLQCSTLLIDRCNGFKMMKFYIFKNLLYVLVCSVEQFLVAYDMYVTHLLLIYRIYFIFLLLYIICDFFELCVDALAV